MLKEVLYPVARLESGALVNIRDWRRGDSAWCPHCEEQMVGAQGKENQWHFRHKSVPECAWESYLHKTAKEIIKQGFQSAYTDGARYNVLFPCKCGAWNVKELTQAYTSASLEQNYSLPPGTTTGISVVRPDVTLFPNDGQPLAIEVVVTNDLSEEKSLALLQAGIHWITVRPTLPLLPSLTFGFIADRWSFSNSCKACSRMAQLVDEVYAANERAAQIETLSQRHERKVQESKEKIAELAFKCNQHLKAKNIAVQEAIARREILVTVLGEKNTLERELELLKRRVISNA